MGMAVKRLGVFGGTFDPPHRGHLALALAARRQLALEAVWFMPAGQPRMKPNCVTPASTRAEMVALTTRGRAGFRVSRTEVNRPGVTYSVDTLARLRQQLGPDAEIYFIMSWQTLDQFPDWRQPEHILELARIAAAPRPGTAAPDIEVLERRLPGLGARLVLLEMPPLDISATMVRRKASRGESLRELVTPAVADYIRRRGLYRPVDRRNGAA
jgi:nicotinate-nucleotide adenylyltransferase